MLIDLSNDYFIVKLYKNVEYERMLLDGPWMIGDNYLHVQCWKPHFRAGRAEINLLPVWVRFPILPIEYYAMGWLKRAGDNIGKTIKVDIAMLLMSKGKFACVCIEVDLEKPFKSGCQLRGEFWRLQYEGFHDICFDCGRYGIMLLSAQRRKQQIRGRME